MNVVVIFDVSSNTPEIRSEMTRRGYFTGWIVTGATPKITYSLPHNTVWKKDIEINAALTELQSVITSYNQANLSSVVLQRCIILPSTPWGGIPGVPV